MGTVSFKGLDLVSDVYPYNSALRTILLESDAYSSTIRSIESLFQQPRGTSVGIITINPDYQYIYFIIYVKNSTNKPLELTLGRSQVTGEYEYQASEGLLYEEPLIKTSIPDNVVLLRFKVVVQRSSDTQPVLATYETSLVFKKEGINITRFTALFENVGLIKASA